MGLHMKVQDMPDFKISDKTLLLFPVLYFCAFIIVLRSGKFKLWDVVKIFCSREAVFAALAEIRKTEKSPSQKYITHTKKENKIMNGLDAFNYNGAEVVDSREVAEMIGKNHKDLLRDIRGYIEIMENSGERKIAPSDFFIPSVYTSARNKEMPCYLLTKKGCDMVANKLTGEKGVLFTAAYVTAFEDMHSALTGAIHAAPEVSLRGISSFIHVMRRVMLDAGRSPAEVERMAFSICRTWHIPLPEMPSGRGAWQLSLWEADPQISDEYGL